MEISGKLYLDKDDGSFSTEIDCDGQTGLDVVFLRRDNVTIAILRNQIDKVIELLSISKEFLELINRVD